MWPNLVHAAAGKGLTHASLTHPTILMRLTLGKRKHRSYPLDHKSVRRLTPESEHVVASSEAGGQGHERRGTHRWQRCPTSAGCTACIIRTSHRMAVRATEGVRREATSLACGSLDGYDDVHLSCRERITSHFTVDGGRANTTCFFCAANPYQRYHTEEPSSPSASANPRERGCIFKWANLRHQPLPAARAPARSSWIRRGTH